MRVAVVTHNYGGVAFLSNANDKSQFIDEHNDENWDEVFFSQEPIQIYLLCPYFLKVDIKLLRKPFRVARAPDATQSE